MMHTTKQFKTDGIIMGANTVGLIPQRITVRYSMEQNGFASVSFANDKNISIQVVVDDNFKKMARELLK